MKVTVLKLITKAAEKAGVAAAGETISQEDVNSIFDDLNFMLDELSTDTLIVRGTVQTSKVLTAGTYIYTIGTGGDFNTPKPLDISSAFIKDSSEEVYPVDIIGKEDFNGLSDRLIVAYRPNKICYDPSPAQQASQLGNILTYPTPDASTTYTLFIEQLKALTEFATLTEKITLEPMYYSFLMWNLAKYIWPSFHPERPVSIDIMRESRISRDAVSRVNVRKMTMSTDVPTSTGTKPSYNIYTDQGG